MKSKQKMTLTTTSATEYYLLSYVQCFVRNMILQLTSVSQEFYVANFQLRVREMKLKIVNCICLTVQLHIVLSPHYEIALWDSTQEPFQT